jgi:ankyrin repeat protein
MASGIAFAITAATLVPGAHADAYADFFEAIGQDDVRAVRLALLRGVSPNSPDRRRGPALVYAIREKSMGVVDVLLEYPGTDVNVRNALGESALMFAAQSGQVDLVKRLIGRGAEINKAGWAALHYAAATGQLAVIELLLEHHAYIDAASENGTTPLMVAARENQVQAARLLVERGADPSLRNEAGLGATEYLVRVGATEDANWMRERAAEYLRRYGTKEAPVPAGGGAAGSGR